MEFQRRSDKCAICLGECPPESYTPCKHYFHMSCIKSWLKMSQTCPICKVPVQPRQCCRRYVDCFSSDDDEMTDSNDPSY
jgi:hypothetical protein